MRSAIAALLLILPSSQASALCAGQSPDQKVIFEDRFADNAAQWFLGDRDLTNPTISNGVMTIETPVAEVVPKRQIVDPLAGSPVSRSTDICVRFSWPPSSIPDDVPGVGIITHAFLGRDDRRTKDRITHGEVRAVHKTGTLEQFVVPGQEEVYPITIAKVPEVGTDEVVELRVVTTWTPRDDASEASYLEKYFINGKMIKEKSGRVAIGSNSRMPQSYGVFVTGSGYMKRSFPIRYFNVLSLN